MRRARLLRPLAGVEAVGIVEAEIKTHFVYASVPDLQYLAMLAMVILILLVRPQGLLGRTA